MNKIDIVILNLKLSRTDRDSFKKKVKENHRKTMQEMLELFIKTYNKSPAMFNIKLEVSNGKQ
jgi:hypothetical protein